MRKTRALIIALLLFISFSSAFAAKGVVVLYKSGCDFYIVKTNNGYAILEWYGGNDPSEGDILVGEFETFGMKDIYNLTADAETTVWVEDFWLPKSSAIEKYYEECD